MKNPATAAAFMLVGLALLVGGFAYLTTGDESPDKPSAVITHGEGSTVGFAALTPREQRKKANMEAAKRKLKRIREQGREVMPGVYRMKDENGEPTYFLSELVEGVGRNGEPLYMAVEFKRRPMLPLKQPKLLSGKAAPKAKRLQKSIIQPIKPAAEAKTASTSGGSGGANGGQGGGSGKKGGVDPKDG